MGLIRMIAYALGVALTSIDAHADPCPLSCVLDICTAAPRSSVTQYYPTILGPDARATASYDLVAGSLHADVYSGGDGGPRAEARATDRFILVGPTSLSPVSFAVAFRVVAGTDCFCGGTDGTLREGSGSALIVSVPYYDPACGCVAFFVDSTLTLPLRHAVGEPFELSYTASAAASGFSKAGQTSGTLFFPYLPPGYGIVSCQGFTAGTTPTRPVSWGMLKVRYR